MIYPISNGWIVAELLLQSSVNSDVPSLIRVSQTINKMETILEQQRRYHEERERLSDSMVKELLLKKTSVSKCFTILKFLPIEFKLIIVYL